MCLVNARVHLQGTSDLLAGPPPSLTRKGRELLPLTYPLIIKTLKGSNPFGLLSQPARESQLIRQPAPLLQAFLLSTTICINWQNGLQTTLMLNKEEKLQNSIKTVFLFNSSVSFLQNKYVRLTQLARAPGRAK